MARKDDLNAALRSSLTTLLGRVTGHLHLDLDHDGLLAVSAPAEHHDILRHAASVASAWGDAAFNIEVPISSNPHMDWATISLQAFAAPGNTAPLAPRNPAWQRGETPAHLAVTSWVAERVRIGREFGLASLVLDWLISNCDHAQMRFLFPAVMQLAATSDGSAYNDTLRTAFIDKHREFKAPKSLPAVPPGMRQALQDAATTLTLAAMIEPAEAPKFVPVHIGLVEYDRPVCVGDLEGPTL